VPASKTDSDADGMRAVARTVALYLQARIQPHQILAIAWGKTMFEVARALDENPMEGLVVAQSIGGLNSGEAFNPLQVTSLIGEKLHARIYTHSQEG
jgi:DNA-binding transcriptional regulator LsrR (DeoR family)